MLVALALGAEGVPPASDGVGVRVQLLHPSGAVLVAGGASVRLERRRMPRPGEEGTPEVIAAWQATAAADGSARFEGLPPLGMAESDRIVVRWQGATTTTPLEAKNDGRQEPLKVVVREVSRDLGVLRMAVRLTLSPRDTGLQVEQLFQLENPTNAVIDTDQATGLVLPLVAPAPFDEPVAAFLPARPDSNELLTQQNPEEGRVLVERGQLVFRGPVTPEGALVWVVYVLPYDGQTSHTYGLRMPVAASSVLLVLRSPERVAPAVSFRRPSDVVVRPFLGGEERSALLREPLAGAVVLFDVQGTPDRHVFLRPLAAGLGAVVVVVLVVMLAAGRRRASPR